MHAGNRSDDGQTQPVVLMCAAACAVATEEAIKQPWQVRRFDGRTLIGNRQTHFAASQPIDLHEPRLMRTSVRPSRAPA